MKIRTRLAHPLVALAVAAVTCAALPAAADAATRPMLVRFEPNALSDDTVGRHTDACIAQARARDFAAAAAACDAAIEGAQGALRVARQSSHAIYLVRDARETLALTYSNRAVLHWLQGESQASAVVAHAARLAPQMTAVRINMVALDTPRVATIAQR